MKKLFIIILLSLTHSWTNSYAKDEAPLHSQHSHDVLINGENFAVDQDRLNRFLDKLKGVQIAVVNVKGMVCDFCARGIEKTFIKDPNVERVDVDLAKGKVMIAYLTKDAIDFEDIKKRILSNGQNATSLKVINL